MADFSQTITNYSPVFSVVFLVLGILLIVWNIILHSILKKIKNSQNTLFSGDPTKNIEKIVLDQKEELKNLDTEVQELYDVTDKINRLTRKSIHKVGVVRFNPFKDIGGNQSFSIAFMDADNNGLVLSSLHTREGNRTYAKTITSGESAKFPLTEEEKSAIEIAGVKKKELSKNKKI